MEASSFCLHCGCSFRLRSIGALKESIEVNKCFFCFTSNAPVQPEGMRARAPDNRAEKKLFRKLCSRNTVWVTLFNNMRSESCAYYLSRYVQAQASSLPRKAGFLLDREISSKTLYLPCMQWAKVLQCTRLLDSFTVKKGECFVFGDNDRMLLKGFAAWLLLEGFYPVFNSNEGWVTLDKAGNWCDIC